MAVFRRRSRDAAVLRSGGALSPGMAMRFLVGCRALFTPATLYLGTWTLSLTLLYRRRFQFDARYRRVGPGGATWRPRSLWGYGYRLF